MPIGGAPQVQPPPRAAPLPPAVPVHVGDALLTGTHSKPVAPRRKNQRWLIVAVGFVAILLLVVVLTKFYPASMRAKSQYNARCPLCNTEFNIYPMHRGLIEQNNSYHYCPNPTCELSRDYDPRRLSIDDPRRYGPPMSEDKRRALSCEYTLRMTYYSAHKTPEQRQVELDEHKRWKQGLPPIRTESADGEVRPAPAWFDPLSYPDMQLEDIDHFVEELTGMNPNLPRQKLEEQRPPKPVNPNVGRGQPGKNQREP
jgi:hypothetical protein